MDTEISKSIARHFQDNWELQIPETFTESELLELLAAKISMLIERQPETFFQLMYRLDIPEKKLNAVLGNMDAIDKIARLVYERQLEKARSRQQYRDENPDIDKNLQW
jgi:hypothetical protein